MSIEMTVENAVDRDPFEVVAEGFLARFRKGERPSIKEYASLYPELAARIHELFPALVRVEQDLTLNHGSAPSRQPARPSRSDIAREAL